MMLRQMLINDGGGRSSKAARGNDGSLWNEGKKKKTTTAKTVEDTPSNVFDRWMPGITKQYTPIKPVDNVKTSDASFVSRLKDKVNTVRNNVENTYTQQKNKETGSYYVKKTPGKPVEHIPVTPETTKAPPANQGSNLADAGVKRNLNEQGKLDAGYYEENLGGSTLADAGKARQIVEQGKVDAGYYAPGGAYYDFPEPPPRTTTDPNPEIDNLRDQLAGVNPNYDSYIGAVGARPEMRSAQSMANHLGIDYDKQKYLDMIQNAVKEQYNNLDTEHARNQADYYRMTGQSAVDLGSELMRGDRRAAMTGASAGTSIAEKLMAMQTMGQANAEGATEIGRLRADLVGQREAAMAQTYVDAEQYYADLGIQLGTLSAREQDALVQAYGAEIAGAASRYEADKAYQGTLRAALANAEAAKYSADQSYNATLDSRAQDNAFQKWLLNNPSYKSMMNQ